MSRLARVAIAVAAVIVVVVGAIQLLPRGGNVGSSPTIAPPTPVVTLPASGALEPGRYRFGGAFTARPFTIDVPAGWSVAESSFIIKGASSAPIDRVEDSVISFSPWIVDHLFTDGCHTQDMQPVEQSKQALIDGLAGLPDRAPSAPVDTSVDGLPATAITLKVAPDFDLAGCGDNPAIRNWPDPGGSADGGWLSFPGQTDEITVVDAGGDPVVLVLSYKGGARPSDVDAMRSMMTTIRFESESAAWAAPSSPPAT